MDAITRHLIWKLGGIGLVLAGIAVFCLAMDPFRVFGLVERPILAADSPFLRIGKPYEVRRIKPDALVLGTSRALALTADLPQWNGARAYNLALHGADMYELLRNFQHAVHVAPPRTLVVGLDLFNFNMAKAGESNFDERRFSVDADGRPQTYPFWEIFPSLLSSDALAESWGELCADQGWNWCLKPTRRSDRVFKLPGTLGQRVAFLENEADYRFHLYFTAQHPDFVLAQSSDPPFDHLHGVLALARKKGVDAYFYISPVHARQLELIRALGLWGRFETWKRRLVDLFRREAMDSGARAYPLWDFSGYDSLTTEAVPTLGEGARKMHWYRESSHFTKAMAGRLLGVMLQSRTTEGQGRLIDADNIGRHLSALREAGNEYRMSHRQDVAEVAWVAALPSSDRSQWPDFPGAVPGCDKDCF